LSSTYVLVEGVAVKVPGGEELDALALRLGPLVAVGKRGEKGECGKRHSQEDNSAHAVENVALLRAHARDPGSDVVKQLAEGDDGKVERREIVV